MAFSSIDLEGMSQLVDRMVRASENLHSTATDLRGQASRESVSTTATWKISGVASWVDGELPMLRRRLELARAADAVRAQGLRGTTVTIAEPVVDAAEAEQRARDLAERLLAVDSTDEEGAAELHAIAEELELIGLDPDAMAVFWGEAGPQWAELLPAYLTATGSDTAAADFEIFSLSFTTALHDTDPPPDFVEVTDRFREEPGDPGTAWARLALIQQGSPPTDFLVDVVEVNSLVFLREQTGQWDPRDMSSARGLHLPDDAHALAFTALAKDPVAVRRAIPNGTRGEMVDIVYGYARYMGTGDDVADAFGRAIEAGAGVHDEEIGEHSPSAYRFAFEVISASAKHDDVPWVIKDSLGRLAASYAPEILAGTNLRDAAGRESGMGRPDGWTAHVGMDPDFYLSVEDTYSFLRSFGDDDSMSAPFDAAVEDLFEKLMGDAMVFDSENLGAGQLNETANLFGNLAGIQYVAQKDIRGSLDERDKAIADALNKGLNFVIGKVPTPAGQAAGWAWKAFKWGFKKGVAEWRANGAEETRVALLDDATLQAAFLLDYQVFLIMSERLPETTVGLPTDLRGPDGALLDPETITGDPELFSTFLEWIDSTDADFTGGTPDDIVDDASGMIRGGFQQGEQWAGQI